MREGTYECKPEKVQIHRPWEINAKNNCGWYKKRYIWNLHKRLF
jgi:hypothetical protein